jgi:hypothetical protein
MGDQGEGAARAAVEEIVLGGGAVAVDEAGNQVGRLAGEKQQLAVGRDPQRIGARVGRLARRGGGARDQHPRAHLAVAEDHVFDAVGVGSAGDRVGGEGVVGDEAAVGRDRGVLADAEIARGARDDAARGDQLPLAGDAVAGVEVGAGGTVAVDPIGHQAGAGGAEQEGEAVGGEGGGRIAGRGDAAGRRGQRGKGAVAGVEKHRIEPAVVDDAGQETRQIEGVEDEEAGGGDVLHPAVAAGDRVLAGGRGGRQAAGGGQALIVEEGVLESALIDAGDQLAGGAAISDVAVVVADRHRLALRAGQRLARRV